MEKWRPHCKLSRIKILVESGKVRATASALEGARSLGIDDLAGMCDLILSLRTDHFYKSMTTLADHTVWQDVYRAVISDNLRVYLKLTVFQDVLIVSFKEL